MDFINAIQTSWENMNETYPLIILIFMGIDIISGLVASWIGKITFSSVMYHGIQKKISILVGIVFLFFVDVLFGFNLNIFNTCCMFYCAYEGLSIIENLYKCGIPIPKFIVDHMEAIKDKTDGGDV